MSDVWDNHHRFASIRFRGGSRLGGWLPVPLHQSCGVTIVQQATCFFSTSLSGTLEHIRSAWMRIVRTTATLCASGWWESKSRYQSEWVFFLKTAVVSEPSLCLVTLVSKIGSDPSCSNSIVNLMVVSIEFR